MDVSLLKSNHFHCASISVIGQLLGEERRRNKFTLDQGELDSISRVVLSYIMVLLFKLT